MIKSDAFKSEISFPRKAALIDVVCYLKATPRDGESLRCRLHLKEVQEYRTTAPCILLKALTDIEGKRGAGISRILRHGKQPTCKFRAVHVAPAGTARIAISLCS